MAGVRRDLPASIATDDTAKVETLELINILFSLNIAHVGWSVRGVRSMVPKGEVIPRP